MIMMDRILLLIVNLSLCSSFDFFVRVLSLNSPGSTKLCKLSWKDKNSKCFSIESNHFKQILDYPGLIDSVIECANFASIHNKEMSNPLLPDAINAFKFDKSAQTCVIGRIGYVHLKNMTTWSATDQNGIHLLYGCVVKGKILLRL